MRIVHDINSEPEVSGSGDLYGVTPTEPGDTRAAGFRADLLIVAPCPDGVDEAIYIEGDARLVRKALVQALLVLDMTAKSYVDDGKLSPNWADPAKEGA